MKTDEEILAEVAAVARQHLAWGGSLDRECRLVEDLELDSLGSLTLAIEVENHFRICLDPESEAQIVTVGNLVDTIRRKLEQAHANPE